MADFEKASRIKLRFETNTGELTSEQLWELPLTSETRLNLDDIARGLHRQLKAEDHVSFVTPPSAADETIQLRFDIVKHIIDVKVAERDARDREKERAAKKQRILEQMNRLEDKRLDGMSREELEAELAGL